MTFKIISWNINGIRSLKVPFKEFLDSFQADIICLQETKVTRDQIDETTANVKGYSSYFSFSKKKSGYSGVVTYCKDEACPVTAEEGLSGELSKMAADRVGSYGSIADMDPELLHSLDGEGRCVITKHKVRLRDGRESELVVVNVYCPRSDPEKPERRDFKMHFYRLLQCRTEAILETGSHVIILGDINTSHRPIDSCDPGDQEEFSNRPDRKWLDQFLACGLEAPHLQGGKFLDSFRHFHPTQKNAFTCWCTLTGARRTNYGTRIDYILVDETLCKSEMTDCLIMPDVEGSDHCPIQGTFLFSVVPASKCPSMCSKFWPEFSGKQAKLSSYLKRTNSKRDLPPPDSSKPEKQKKMLDFFSVARTKNVKIQNACVRETDEPLNSANPAADKWRALLGGRETPPNCEGHGEPCVLRTVRKQGPNFRREFYACARPMGHSTNLEASCNHFKWVKTTK